MQSIERRAASIESEPWREHSTGFASVSVFLTNNEGKLLMVQDLDKFGGKWSSIGGYIDDLDHEEPEMAALRETKEELGLDVRLDDLLGVWHYYDRSARGASDNNVHMRVGYAYTGTILGGTFNMQKEEIQNYGFFTPEQVEELNRQGKLKTPQYHYVGFKLWQSGVRHPLTTVQTNGSIR
ncbi:MAG: NUDIX hydrolase [Chloroflexi bacterium]|nr:NUDIX hydrolase [Chloroflexota bacterium]